MITKKYTATDMQDALQQIKEEMGTDAIIVSSRVVPGRKGIFGLFAKKAVEVVATYDETKKSDNSRFQRQPNGRTAYVPAKKKYEFEPAEFSSVGAGSAAVAYGAPAKPAPKPAPIDLFARQRADAEPHKNRDASNIDAQIDEMNKMLRNMATKVEDLSRGKGVPTEQLTPDAADYCRKLEAQDVRKDVAHSICAQAQDYAVRKGLALPEVLESLIADRLGDVAPIKITKFQQKIVMVIGPTGVGKTTTLVKLASDIIVNNDLKVGVINSDVFRVAAQDHLNTYCDILGCNLVTVYTPSEVSDAIEALSDCDVIFLDTAGKVSHDEVYKKEIADIISYGNIDDIFLTISASTNERVMKDTLDNYAFLNKHRILVTKVDEASTLGVLLNIKELTSRPLSYMTTGQAVPDDIEKIDVQAVARRLME